MRGTVYFKKWSTMPWWSRLYHIRKQSYTAESQRLGKEMGPLINFIDYKFKTEILHAGRDKIKEKKDTEVDAQQERMAEDREFFIGNLFEKYPQMRGVTVFDNVDATRDQNSQLYKVIETLYKKYRNKLRAGFMREAAFSDVVKEFQDYVDLRLAEAGRTENIATSLRAMNLVDYLKAQKIKESNYKSRQLERDAHIDELDDISERLNENHSIHHKIVKQNPEDLMKVSSEELVEDLLKEQLIEVKYKHDKTPAGFIERSFNLLNRYYEKELVQDRLAGLSNADTMMYIRNSPTALKKRFTPLIKFCNNHRIKLDAVGNVDTSEVTDKNLLHRIKKDINKIKFVLMLSDLEFGFTHRLNQRTKLTNLRKTMLSYNKEATENFNKMNEDRLKQLKEASKLPASELDKSTGFEYAEKGTDVENLKKDLNQTLFNENLTEEKFIEGKFDRIDWNERLVDSIEERNLKLEQLWLQHRQRDVEDLDQDVVASLSEKYKKVTKDLRRLKLKLDKEALEKSSKVFFDEHISFNMELEDVPMETLADYFKISQSIIEKNVLDLVEQKKVMEAIKPGILVKDLIPHNEPNVLGEKDLKEEYWDATRKKAYEATEVKMEDKESFKSSMLMQVSGLSPKFVDNFVSNMDVQETEKDLLLRVLDRKHEMHQRKAEAYQMTWTMKKERQSKTKKEKNIQNRLRKKGK